MPSQDSSLREIEIKLSAHGDTLKKIVNHSIFKQYSQVTWRQKALLNQYIDSPDYHLTKAGMALRVRKDGEQYIQTLKTKGNSIGGFSERDEFDWYLNQPQLDTSLLVAPYWPEALAEFDKTKLATIFSTDFIRNYAQFIWIVDGVDALIEVAIDKGTVQAKQQQANICELELELKSGSAETMLNFAVELASHFPLTPCNLSKAERGYRLIDPSGYKKVVNKGPVEDSVNTQIKHCVAISQYYWEYYCWQAESTKIMQWLDTLQQLYSLLKKHQIEVLADLLAPILLDWQAIASSHQAFLQNKVFEESTNTRWGVFLLSVSRWLLNNH